MAAAYIEAARPRAQSIRWEQIHSRNQLSPSGEDCFGLLPPIPSDAFCRFAKRSGHFAGYFKFAEMVSEIALG